ncbi:GNAT family N-acetyltransferase [Defluviimonas sp. SAOS-178_SWC]|uniref:GNAT family N-acetyltransferase n=1 Tax=Defluviimonas sp. SAOS-178_SWC TaxID=3121287 RepID=UPI003D80AF19
MLRPAEEADIDPLVAQWNRIIRDTTITFTNLEKTPESLRAMIAERRRAGREFFVARVGDAVGFATYDQFRGGPGYAHAMEHTILLAPDLWGKGAGRALMARIEDHARAGGAHTLFAGVSGENEAGIAFHRRMGFDTEFRYPEAGRKFGRWLDLVLMMKRLG